MNAQVTTEQEHPIVAAPYTRTQWHKYVFAPDVPRPQKPPTFEEYLALPAGLFVRLRHERTRFHGAGVIVRTPIMQRTHAAFETTLLMNEGQRLNSGALPGLLMDGGGGQGKSTIAKTFAKKIEEDLRLAYPERFEERGWLVGSGRPDDPLLRVQYTPVVYINIPGDVTPKGLSRRFAQFFESLILRKSSATAEEYTDVALAAVEACRTSLVILDDIHFLRNKGKQGVVAIDHLKALQEQMNATFVFTGINVEQHGLFLGVESDSSEQLAGRLSKLEVHGYGAAFLRSGDAAGQGNEAPEERRRQMTEWASIVREMERGIDLYHHEQGSLVAEWRYLLERTDGRVSSLSRLLRNAAVRAIIEAPETGVERVDVPLLDRVLADMVAEDKRRKRDEERRAAAETKAAQAKRERRRARDAAA